MKTKTFKFPYLQAYAWMGGSSPDNYKNVSLLEKMLISAEFRCQIMAFKRYWGNYPDLSTCRTFWNRARHDVHATLRSEDNQEILKELTK